MLNNHKNSESGSILLLFCVMISALLGFMSYSFYVANQVEHRIALQNATDAAGLGLANHAAQGLNMIAANNLTIGASLHVASSVPIAATYASLIYAFTTSISDLPKEVISLAKDQVSTFVPILKKFEFTSRYQDNIWNPLGIIASVYMSTAAGTTNFNQKIAEYWMLPAALKPGEIARLNIPSSLAIAFQESAFTNPTGINAVLMKYDGLETSAADKSVCHAHKASRSISDTKSKESFVSWLLGPMYSLANGGKSAEFMQDFDKLVGTANHFLPIFLTHTECGWGSKGGILSAVEKYGKMFSGNLLSKAGVLAKAQVSLRDSWLHSDVSGTRDFRNCDPSFLGLTPFQYDPPFRAYVMANPGSMNPSKFDHLVELYTFFKSTETIKRDLRDHPEEPNQNNYKCKEIAFNLYTNAFHQSFQSLNACVATTMKKFKDDYAYWERNRSGYTCTIRPAEGGDQTPAVTKYDSIANIDKDGKMQCIDMRKFDPKCVYREYYHSPFSWRCYGKIGRKIAAYATSDTCQDFSVGDAAEDQDKVDEFINFGQQFKTYIDAKDSDERRDQIGFLIVRSPQQFKASLNFMTVATSLVRTSKELTPDQCPTEFKADFDGKKKCQVPMGMDFATFGNESDVEFKLMRGGVGELTDGDLESTWSRTQWVVAATKVVKEEDAESKSYLFWPNFHSKLNSSAFGFVSQIFEKITKSEKDRDEMQAVSNLL